MNARSRSVSVLIMCFLRVMADRSRELGLLDFSVAVSGKVRAHLDVLGNLEALEARTALAQDRGFIEHHAWLEHDEGLDRGPEQLVGDTDHRGLAHALDLENRSFDLDGRDLLAARFDDVIHASNEVEVALVVESAQIAGVEHSL